MRLESGTIKAAATVTESVIDAVRAFEFPLLSKLAGKAARTVDETRPSIGFAAVVKPETAPAKEGFLTFNRFFGKSEKAAAVPVEAPLISKVSTKPRGFLSVQRPRWNQG